MTPPMKSIRIGKNNALTVTKTVDFGVYLDGGDLEAGGWGEILLPTRDVPSRCQVGDVLSVFVYFDSEDRIIATRQTPKVYVNQFAFLRVVDVNAAGAFLDWGLPKDLLAPYVEQSNKMRQGAYYVVYVYQDADSERLVASSKLRRFLDKVPADYALNQLVDGIVMAQTDLGYKVIVNHRHTGMLYHNEVFTPLAIGQTLTAHIHNIRDDGKIDLQMPQLDKRDLSVLEQQIMDKLAANRGVLALSDKTPPTAIYQAFGVSKKHFKRAISRLYKQRLIVIEAHHIRVSDCELTN